MFSKSKLKLFAKKAAAYIKEKYPDKCQILSEQNIEDAITTAFQKRSEYDFKSEYDIIAYLDLMYILGFDFDTNTELPWVRDILCDFDLDARTRFILLKQIANQQKSSY